MNFFHPKYFFDLSSFPFPQLFENCTYVWDVLPRIKTFLQTTELGKIEGDVSESAYLINPEQISIGKGSVVDPGAYIHGPCLIGEGCTIRHGAYIRGNFIAGNGCVIGHDTEIKNSIMLNSAKAAHFAYLGDSVLGGEVNLGAGTVCANLRLDKGEVVIQHNGHRIETGLKKFGAIIGDRSQTGCNAVTNPGTLFGQDVICYPCMNVGGFAPSGSRLSPERP